MSLQYSPCQLFCIYIQTWKGGIKERSCFETVLSCDEQKPLIRVKVFSKIKLSSRTLLFSPPHSQQTCYYKIFIRRDTAQVQVYENNYKEERSGGSEGVEPLTQDFSN